MSGGTVTYRLAPELPVEQYEDWQARKTYTPYWAYVSAPIIYRPHLDFVTSPVVRPRETWEVCWYRDRKGGEVNVLAYVFSQDDAKYVADLLNKARKAPA